MQRWKDKVAVVTGASAGIGRAVAAKLAEEGMRVVAVARRREKLQELADQYKGRIFPLPCDITKDEEIVNLFQKINDTIGPVHVLVNNAGIAYQTSVLECNLKHWRYMFDLNVIALGVATREAVAWMKKNKIDDGYIINISSISSHGMPEGIGKHVYNATKHAVRVITEGTRMELAEQKSAIKVSTICPGVVETEIFDVGGWGDFYTAGGYPVLKPNAIADATVTLLSTPHSTHIADLVVRPLGEKVMA
ncbi:dehydrogenase/reductase SDR family member 11 isoform X2 [Halyomorpha halys]|uniref:dehydrogenase/reductase SDR family member 11 isoform X2 n=1 Tax=Halyomorpha halys TaxID=286706 RepID=UPI0006D52734|nr:dehydrogenase/reductase SDR family member 11-like [Halyomorpha halys]XP_014275110.1 dehydrogenase/reductase SDR family member 11-like [Halyomorpha halys]